MILWQEQSAFTESPLA